MAFSYGFFNAKNLDRVYTAEDFTSYLSSLICDGILDTYGDCFSITAGSNLSVVVGTGKAWIEYVAVQKLCRHHVLRGLSPKGAPTDSDFWNAPSSANCGYFPIFFWPPSFLYSVRCRQEHWRKCPCEPCLPFCAPPFS